MTFEKENRLILRSYKLSGEDIERLETVRNEIFHKRRTIVSHGAIVAAGIFFLSELGTGVASECLEKIMAERKGGKKDEFRVFDRIMRKLKTSAKKGEFAYLKDDQLVRKISKIAREELSLQTK